jgi:phage gpG-like protein
MPYFTGDLSGIQALQARLRELQQVPSQAASEASEEIQELIEAEFDSGHDPYGNPWVPLRPATLARGRRPPPLTDTGAMRDSVNVQPMAGAGIGITIGTEYAPYHQYGTSRMEARPMLPDGDEMPESWVEAVSTACDNAADRRMGGT